MSEIQIHQSLPVNIQRTVTPTAYSRRVDAPATLELLHQDSPECAANDVLMATEMAKALDDAYPNHLWAVTCEGKTGIATIRNLRLSGNRGFILKLPTVYSASEFKKRVVMAGGEVLERYQIARGRLNMNNIRDCKTDFAGQKIHG